MREARFIGRSNWGVEFCQKMLAFALRDVYFGGLGMGAHTHSVPAGWRARGATRRCGATLIELLVVITLIGLLVGSLLPSVGKSMRMASDAICKHHLRELGKTLMLYQIDSNGWLPTMGEPQSGLRAMRAAEPWFAKLFPTYLQDPAVLTCPEDPYRFRMLETGGNFAAPESADAHGAGSGTQPDFMAARAAEFSSYGINSFILTSGNGFLAQEGRRHPSRPLDTLLAADLGPDRGGSESGPGLVGPSRNASLLPWDDGFDPFDPDAPSASWLTTRHGGKINVLTLEGGVRSVKTADILKQPVQSYYSNCAAGGCTFCRELGVNHYSFAKDHIYWWTGSAPSE